MFLFPALITALQTAIPVGSTALITTLALQSEGGRYGFADDAGKIPWYGDFRFLGGSAAFLAALGFAMISSPYKDYRGIRNLFMLISGVALTSQGVTEVNRVAENNGKLLGMVPVRKLLALDPSADIDTTVDDETAMANADITIR